MRGGCGGGEWAPRHRLRFLGHRWDTLVQLQSTLSSSLAMAVVFTLLLSFLSFLQLASRAHAVALTTSIAANDRVCFYADVDKAGEKIGVRIFQPLVCSPRELTSLSI